MILGVWWFSFLMGIGLILSPWPINLACGCLMMLGVAAMMTWGEWWGR